MENRLVMFGAGHMGAAIARGMLRTGAKNLCVIDPVHSKLEEFALRGIPVDISCKELASDDILMLAMQPQTFPTFAHETLCAQAHPGLIISVMAGVRIASIQDALRVRHVVRAIPNTPSEVYEGMTVFCKSNTVDNALTQAAYRILESFGRCAEVSHEALIDPATALCGGGPAFIAYFADALQQFGIQMGIDGRVARRIVIQLLRGTAELLDASGKPAMQICREVMTPGGTTERGIWHFDRMTLTQTIINALTHASLRSSELGKLAAIASYKEHKNAGCQ